MNRLLKFRIFIVLLLALSVAMAFFAGCARIDPPGGEEEPVIITGEEGPRRGNDSASEK